MEIINVLQFSLQNFFFASLHRGGKKTGETQKDRCFAKAQIPTYLAERQFFG